MQLAADVWDTRRALDDNYGRVVELLAKLEQGIGEEKVSALGHKYTTEVPIAVHLAALKEVREHIKLASSLSGRAASLAS